MERWRTAWRFQIFLIATHLFLFIHDVLYAHIRLHKKILCCTKTVVSTKKIFHIEVNVAQQNYVSHKKICCGDKKRYVTPKRRLMLTKYVSCCTEKEYVFTKNDSCCMWIYIELIKKVLCRTKILWCGTNIEDGVHKCYSFLSERRAIRYVATCKLSKEILKSFQISLNSEAAFQMCYYK